MTNRSKDFLIVFLQIRSPFDFHQSLVGVGLQIDDFCKNKVRQLKLKLLK